MFEARGVRKRGSETRAMRSKSPSARAPSPSLRTTGVVPAGSKSRKPIPLEGLARLSTDVFSENPIAHLSLSESKPFLGVVICVTGFSRGMRLLQSLLHLSRIVASTLAGDSLIRFGHQFSVKLYRLRINCVTGIRGNHYPGVGNNYSVSCCSGSGKGRM